MSNTDQATLAATQSQRPPFYRDATVVKWLAQVFTLVLVVFALFFLTTQALENLEPPGNRDQVRLPGHRPRQRPPGGHRHRSRHRRPGTVGGCGQHAPHRRGRDRGRHHPRDADRCRAAVEQLDRQPHVQRLRRDDAQHPAAGSDRLHLGPRRHSSRRRVGSGAHQRPSAPLQQGAVSAAAAHRRRLLPVADLPRGRLPRRLVRQAPPGSPSRCHRAATPTRC